MNRIKILVDTGSDIPRAYCEKYNITIVPLTITIEEKNQKDFYEINGVDYCKYLRTCKDIPTTSQPSPMDFLEIFKMYNQDYDHVICFTMAPAGSGTYNSACLAKGMYDEEEGNGCKIHVIDSKSCSLVEALEAREAGDMMLAGADIDSILTRLEEVRNNVATYYLVDNIDFLIKGGRVSVLKGAVASKLNLKPIIAIRGGEGLILGNAMGYNKGVEKMLSYYKTEAVENACLYISHSDCEEKAMQLINKFKTVYPNLEYVVQQMFCTMATQAGPDTVAMFFIKK